jgi:hypothetical protein
VTLISSAMVAESNTCSVRDRGYDVRNAYKITHAHEIGLKSE